MTWVLSDDLQEAICERLELGESLLQICADKNMPSRETIRRWMRSNADFEANIARARIEQADYMDDRILDVANQCLDGEVEPDAARVSIAAFQWRAGKLKPRKYGDTKQIDATITVQQVDATIAALERQLSDVIDVESSREE